MKLPYLIVESPTLIVNFVNDCNIEEILFKLKKLYLRRKKQIKRANEDGSKDYFKFLNIYLTNAYNSYILIPLFHNYDNLNIL